MTLTLKPYSTSTRGHCMCVNAGIFVHNGHGFGKASGGTLLLVTFDLCHAPLTLTLARPNPGPSLNKVEDVGAIMGII